MPHQFQPREQIVYVPNHAGMDLKHPDCKFGFVTSVSANGETVFCRFFKEHLFYGEHRTLPNTLDTTANSEGCNRYDLVSYDHTTDAIVDRAWYTYVEPLDDYPSVEDL